jgi:TolB protein
MAPLGWLEDAICQMGLQLREIAGSEQQNVYCRSMKKIILLISALVGAGIAMLAQSGGTQAALADHRTPQEKHLKNVRQLTFGGENAEAYFSIDDKKLIFQSTSGGLKCDQIFTMNADGSDKRMISSGKGRTTCSYYFPDNKHVLYSSTEGASPDCPPPADMSQGYVWAIYPGYDIYVANADGSGKRNLTNSPGYDAESTISRDGKKIVFTSTRNGDLDIYTMDMDGKNVNQLTHEIGYDGGPFWSYDGKWIVYRASHPEEPKAIAKYKELLSKNLIRPSTLDLWVMKADGSQKRRLTHFNSASFGPYFFSQGNRVIFSSNQGSTGGMGNFELWAIDVDGKNLERITYNETFDGFPMFNSDGTKLVFASNRDNEKKGDTNLFIADWVK